LVYHFQLLFTTLSYCLPPQYLFTTHNSCLPTSTFVNHLKLFFTSQSSCCC
ncbi:hypothetical protein LOTGIDRAFT_123776, partial [Lottia gigantea]